MGLKKAKGNPKFIEIIDTNKRVPYSFRIEERVLDKLHSISGNLDISTAELLTKIAKDYLADKTPYNNYLETYNRFIFDLPLNPDVKDILTGRLRDNDNINFRGFTDLHLEEEVKTIMVGIDIEAPELLIANQLRLSGKKIDVVLGHHPKGKAFSTFYQVIGMQAEINEVQGVPINISEKLIGSRLAEVGRSVAGSNHQRVFDAARLLNIPMITAHTVADNHVVKYLQSGINALKPRYLKDIVDFLNEQPEYQYARTFGNGPFILNGSDKSKPGKIFVDMTGGTEGPVEMFEKLSAAGVGTIVGMHLSERGYKAAQKAKINVII